MKTLNWFSPRINGPAVIQILLDAESARWICDNLPQNDPATYALDTAIAAVTPEKPQPGGEK